MKAMNIDMLRVCLASQGEWPVRVKGWCMLPAIENNAEVVLEAVAPETLCAGDLVAYRHQGALLTHRFVLREGNFFVMRPDNRPEREDLITAVDIVGRVREVRNPSFARKVLNKLIRLFAKDNG
ncbi:MAG: S24/S26 family peptidase [Fibrobacterota bacterium]